MLEPIEITGRGKLTIEAKYERHKYHRAVLLRIDDAARPEFWAEVRIDQRQLETLLKELRDNDLVDENYGHDECPRCHIASVPAEGVPDQELRGCPRCHETWVED